MGISTAEAMKARCGAVGKLAGLVFWGLLLLLLLQIGYGVWLFMQPTADYTAQSVLLNNRITESYAFFRQGVYVHSSRVVFSETGMQHPKQTFLLCAWCGNGALLFLLGVLWNIRAVFRGIRREGTAFTRGASRAVFRAGLCILAASLIESALFPVLGSVMGVVSGYDFLNPGELLTGGIVIALSFIFEYGTALQTQADETL